MNTLQRLLDKQEDLQIILTGHSPVLLDTEEKIDAIKEMTLALEDELHEALVGVGWKSWATSRHIDQNIVHGELTDVLFFFLNLCLLTGLDGDELIRRYDAKWQKNVKRHREGYDGVTGKCKSCHQALDDSGVKCTENWCAINEEAAE